MHNGSSLLRQRYTRSQQLLILMHQDKHDVDELRTVYITLFATTKYILIADHACNYRVRKYVNDWCNAILMCNGCNVRDTYKSITKL